jgi:hypothetical protein
MAANSSPIFSAFGDIQGGDILTTVAAADYTGQGLHNVATFAADATNGGFVQRTRFKALGTNVATVARLYINNGLGRLATIAGAASTPSGTPSASGGSLLAGAYYAKIVAVDQYGVATVAGTESALVTVPASVAGSIAWTWTAVAGAKSYQIWTGSVVGGELTFFTSTTNSFSQTAAIGTRGSIGTSNNNNYLYGEISLPATTAIATAATAEIDYPMNLALPPGYRIIVGLGTAVAAGWLVTTIGGSY